MINKKPSIKILRYILVFALFLTASPIFAKTCGVTASGGTRNVNAATTWFDCSGSIPLSGDDVVATSTSGNVIMNTSTNVLKSFDFSTYGGTLSGTGTILVRGLAGTTNDIKFGGTVTWTGVLDIRNVSTSALLRLTTNGKLLTAITTSLASNATTTLQDNLSFTATKTNTLTLGNAGFDMNGFTISGNSATNRLLIQSNTLGTQREITPNGGTFANADFTDIRTNTSTNLSTITGNSGDCGGNSNITFTTPVAQTWSGTASDSWSTNAWTTRVPLCQDDVSIASAFTPAGRVITIDMPRLGTNIDFTGTTGTPAITLTLGITNNIYGSLTLIPSLTITNINTILQFSGRSSYTFTSAGLNILPGITLNAPGGTLSLQDDLTAGRTLNNTLGTFNANNFNITIGASFNAGNTTSSITNMGSGTWTMTGTGSNWVIGANAVINAQTSTIAITNKTATAKTFAGAGKTYNKVTFSGDNIAVTGANTFNILDVANAGYGGANGLSLPTGVGTTTINFLTTNATTTSDRAKLDSATSGTLAGLQANTGSNICVDYMQIQDIRAYGTSLFYAGTNSLDVSGNSGWFFTGCPATAPSSRSTKTIFQRLKSIIRGKFIIR